jgi:ubiquinone/menaquinone biosynthesis C-methylase UbiE
MITNPKKLKCICGSVDFNKYDRQLYEVTPEGKTIETTSNGVYFYKCKCGIVRQGINSIDYKEYPPSNPEYKAKDYEHDLYLGMQRVISHKIKEKDVVLDVGSGSGAFIEACRAIGAEAYGCEITDYHYKKSDEFTYKKRFEDVHFPVDMFDKVTCHDVLEHIQDPVSFVKEMFRVTKQGGECIIDVPNFFCPEGKHHWKEEHIWFLNETQMIDLLSKAGFKVDCYKKPVLSKIVFYCTKPKQKRTKILVPPGMGDAYWSVVKMQSFMETIGKEGEIPDVYVACNKDRKREGHKRAFPFLKLFPFLKSTEISFNTSIYPKEIWLEAYRDAGRTVFEDICGCDYFLSYNGQLSNGFSLDEVDGELDCNWIPDMFESLDQMNYEKACKNKYGKYIVFYFLFHGHYGHWQGEFTKQQMINSVNMICQETDSVPVFAGAVWDSEFEDQTDVINNIPFSIDLRGKTSVEELFGLIKGSKCVVGYPSGLTIMSTVLKQKTVIIWNDYYNKDFMWNSCPPEVRNKSYLVVNTKDAFPKYLTRKVKELTK